jgi:ABC-2 type transport system ATP-binding protein
MTATIAPLIVSHVSKRYDSNLVLDDVSLSLIPGEIFGLIGLNGVGKTTLIKTVLDLTRPDNGDIRLFGEPGSMASSRRHISYLPEKFQPSRYLRGEEYLALCLSYFGKSVDRSAQQQAALSLDFDPSRLAHKVGSYSKGMGQKLGLMGAFLVGAPFLILDEPMSGLDPKARILLKEKLLAQKALGKTLFFSSHILSDIEEICDRIGVISNSKLIYVGTPQEFKRLHPEPTLEKSFLRAIA